MTQLPTLCMVNYDQEEPPGFRYRLPGDWGHGRRSGPLTSPRQSYSLPNSPRYAHAAYPSTAPAPRSHGAGHAHGSIPVGAPTSKHTGTNVTSKDDSYATQLKNSSSMPLDYRDKLKSRSHEHLPALFPENLNSRTPNNSTADPSSRDRGDARPVLHASYNLPPLKTMGETSLTANAELLDEPKWNEPLQAWVASTQGTAFAYISFAGAFSLKDRGIYDHHHGFEDEPLRPCPRFLAHMNRTLPTRAMVREVRKRVNKKPEFWTWKGRTPISVPKPRPKRKVHTPHLSPVPDSSTNTIPTPPSEAISSPVLWENVLPLDPSPQEAVDGQIETSSVPSPPPQSIPESPSLPSGKHTPESSISVSLQSAKSTSTSVTHVHEGSPSPVSSVSVSPHSVIARSTSVETPLELLRLSSPPHTPTTVDWGEVLSLAGRDGQFEEDEDGNLVIPDAFSASCLVPLHFTVDYLEVLEPQVYGEAVDYDPNTQTSFEVVSGLPVTSDPTLKIEAPWVPDVQDVDRVKINSPPPPPIPAPKVPTPPPPKEPTPPPPPPPPPKSPTPSPKTPTPPPKEPTPPPVKKKKKKIVKKTKPPPPPPPKTPKCPTPKPPTPKPPTPKLPTPKPPTPTPTPPKDPTPPPPPPKVELPPLPPVVYRDPTPPPPPTPTPPPEPPPKEPTPEPPPPPPPVVATPTPPTPTPPPRSPSPEERHPLPPAQKDPEFLAEMERQRLAELRRQRALAAFESLKAKKFVKKDKPIPEDLTFKEYGWLAQFCILKEEKVRMYQMAFDTVDEDEDGFLSPFETLLALKGITGSSKLTEKEEAYIRRVLDLADYNLSHGTDFKLFSLMAALYQRMSSIDKFVRNVIDKMDLETLDWKIFRAKELFNWCLDERTRRVQMDRLLIELRAGGVSNEHRQECEEILGPKGPLDLLDYLTYLPLFVLMHDSVVTNPLDMTMDK